MKKKIKSRINLKSRTQFENNSEISNICIISTGGTIEKNYDEDDGKLKNMDTRLKDVLMSRLRLPYTNIEFYPILSMDSLYMSTSDRKFIIEKSLQYSKGIKPLVILHGTDTLSVTAEYLYNNYSKPSVPIIFTGAMKPMGFLDSDALQNVTEAILACRLLKAGIYVSFHGRVFTVPNVVKNKKLKTFEVVKIKKSIS